MTNSKLAPARDNIFFHFVIFCLQSGTLYSKGRRGDRQPSSLVERLTRRTWLQLPIFQRTHGLSTLHERRVGGLGSWIQRSAVTGTLSTGDRRCLHSTVRVCWPRSQLVEHSLQSVMSQLPPNKIRYQCISRYRKAATLDFYTLIIIGPIRIHVS